MVLTYSIFNAKACFSGQIFALAGTLLAIFAGHGFARETVPASSLQPGTAFSAQAKSQLETVAELLSKEKLPEAIQLLRTIAEGKAQSAPAAKHALSELLLDQLLQPGGADKKEYAVKKGDSLFAIAKRENCTVEYLVQVNGLQDRARLGLGQKLWVRPLFFRLVIEPQKSELSLFDGMTFIKSYQILAQSDLASPVAKTTIKSKMGSHQGKPVSPMNEDFLLAEKHFSLADGALIGVVPADRNLVQQGFFLSSEDIEELALFLRPGNEVEILR